MAAVQPVEQWQASGSQQSSSFSAANASPEPIRVSVHLYGAVVSECGRGFVRLVVCWCI